MTYDDIILDSEVTRFADLLPADVYNDTVQRSVMGSRGRGVVPDYARDLLISALQDALRAYAQTEHTTRTGGILRKVAKFLSYLNPMRWINSK